MKRFVIVGAGISGLAFAYECLLRGHEVLLVENTGEVGGLARSVTHNDCRLDIGVHVLYLKDPQVRAKIAELIPSDQWLRVRRNGKLFIKNRYMDWPPTPRSLFQLPLSFSIRVLCDQIFKKAKQEGTENFEKEVLGLYGPTLYNSFFHPLTKKFLRTDPQKVHADWAFSSLRAATKIEDKSFNETNKYLTQNTDAKAKKDFNILKFLLQSLKTDRNNEPFYYFHDGFGAMVDAYKTKILQLGGHIVLNQTVSALTVQDNKLTQCIVNGHAKDIDELVWTGSPFALCQLLGIDCPRLEFLHSRFVFVFLKKCLKDHQVCYYADADVSFVRGTILSNHSKTIIRNKNVSDVLCLEYTFKSPDEMNTPLSDMAPSLTRELIKVKMIEKADDIESLYEIKAPYSYPILTPDYREKAAELQEKLACFGQLTVLGRQATFNYENSDIIIKNVLRHPLFQDAPLGEKDLQDAGTHGK